MLLQAPAESPYDVQFKLFGFPIRISWTFWLGSMVFGFNLVQLMDGVLAELSPGLAALYALWMFCLLVSITVHELGHALAFRQFGIESSIVLYHFGGLAIPRDSFGSGGSVSRLNAKQDMWIAFAGPLAQFGSAVVIIAVVLFAGYRVPAFGLWPLSLAAERVPRLTEGARLDSAGLIAMTTFYIWPSVAWAILNLVPVWPLDGGRISRSLVVIGGGNTYQALWISLVVGGLMALYGFRSGQTFMGILFLSLALGNYQMLQQRGDWRY